MCTCTTLNRRRLLGLLPGLAAAAVVSGPLAACGDKTGPRPVRWGEETCAYCGTVIKDPHFAAEVRDGTGQNLWKFDDIGCGAMFLAKQSWTDDIRVEFWTGDIDHGSWLDGRLAWFVGGQQSPHGYGFGAVANKRTGAVDFAAFRAAVAAKEPA